MNEDYQDLPPAVKEELSRAMDAMEAEMDVEEIRAMLESNKDGRAKNNRHNCKVILQHDPLLKGGVPLQHFRGTDRCCETALAEEKQSRVQRHGYELPDALFGGKV